LFIVKTNVTAHPCKLRHNYNIFLLTMLLGLCSSW